MGNISIENKVRIIELDIIGTIIGIWDDIGGHSYKVRYFWQGVPHEVYLYEKEIEKVE